MMTHETHKFFVSCTKGLLLMQLTVTQIPKDQITGSVKFTFPVGGDATVDFK